MIKITEQDQMKWKLDIKDARRLKRLYVSDVECEWVGSGKLLHPQTFHQLRILGEKSVRLVNIKPCAVTDDCDNNFNFYLANKAQ